MLFVCNPDAKSFAVWTLDREKRCRLTRAYHIKTSVMLVIFMLNIPYGLSSYDEHSRVAF